MTSMKSSTPRPEETDFDRIVEASISRRGFLGGTLAFGSFAMLNSTFLSTGAEAAENRFAFEAIPTNSEDAITVPKGFKAEVLVRWGDPLWSDVAGFRPRRRAAPPPARPALSATTPMEWMSSQP